MEERKQTLMAADTKNNNPGPPYAFISQGLALMPYEQVLTAIEENAKQQAKANLKLGPLFRKVADDFREFNRRAEPGWVFQAPEVQLVLIRLAAMIPPAVSLSDEARKKMKAAQEEPTEEEAPQLKIALP
jgi:hypothetical protein